MKTIHWNPALLLPIALLCGCDDSSDEVWCADCGPTSEIIIEEDAVATDFSLVVVAFDAATGWPVAGADVRFVAVWGRSDDAWVSTDNSGYAAYIFSEIYPPGDNPASGWVVEVYAPGYDGYSSSPVELDPWTPSASFDIALRRAW